MGYNVHILPLSTGTRVTVLVQVYVHSDSYHNSIDSSLVKVGHQLHFSALLSLHALDLLTWHADPIVLHNSGS